MASVNWNPLNLAPWQIGLATAGGAVLFIFVVVFAVLSAPFFTLAVLGAQGAFDDKPDASSDSDSGSDSASGSDTNTEESTGYALNKTFTIASIDDPMNTDVTFTARWIQTYTQVDDLNTLPGDAATNSDIKAAWKGSASVGNGNEYVILNGSSVMRLRLAVINQTSGSVSTAAYSAQLQASNTTGTLPQGYSSTWTSNTAGTVGDSLSITYS